VSSSFVSGGSIVKEVDEIVRTTVVCQSNAPSLDRLDRSGG
jgi:hypothetical protein